MNIKDKYNIYIKKRQALLQRLEDYPADMLSFKAGPDKWSALEAVEHLVVVEGNFFQQVSANTPMSTLDPGKRSPDKYQVVLNVMQKDIEVAVPHESVEPGGHYSITELLERWNDIQEKTLAFLDEIDSGQDVVYEHPFAGPLTIEEALAFLEIHFDNHARHMDVILNRAG